MSYRTEEILRDLESGRISDYEAKSALEREYGSCGCMRREIDRSIHDVEYGGRDAWGSSRELDREKESCDRREREERQEEERREDERVRQAHQRQQREYDDYYGY